MPLVGYCPPRLHSLHLSVLFLKNNGHILPNLEIQYLDVILNFSSIKHVFLVSATALLGINKVMEQVIGKADGEKVKSLYVLYT